LREENFASGRFLDRPQMRQVFLQSSQIDNERRGRSLRGIKSGTDIMIGASDGHGKK